MKYKVHGNTNINVTIEVTADSEAAAIETAADELDSLTIYAGNGGTDKLVGVDLEEASISADEPIYWNTAFEVDSDKGDDSE
jgi:hypothetical protein